MLTDKQEKIKDKIRKKEWKIQNMKKEVEAIKKKENTAGGLTSGQQMQMGKNEQVRTNVYSCSVRARKFAAARCSNAGGWE
jgi:hypothetical protein